MYLGFNTSYNDFNKNQKLTKSNTNVYPQNYVFNIFIYTQNISFKQKYRQNKQKYN